MKINITKKEYRLLIDMLQIAEWVMTSHKVEKDDCVETYSEIEEKFLALARDYGFKDLAKYDAKLNRHFITRTYEEESNFMSFVEDYNEESFWDELSERLSVRDLIDDVGENGVKNMEPMKRIEEVEKIREKYENEFDTYGIQRIKIVP